MKLIAWFLALLLSAVVSLWAYGAMLVSVVAGSGRRGRDLAVAFDRLGNVAGGGSGVETFSARCWENRHRKRYWVMVNVIDWVFLKVLDEAAHCESVWYAERLARELACKGQ